MRIVIDGRLLYWTGVGRYTKELVENLEEIDSENEYLVLVRRADWDKWEPKAPNFKKIEANFDPYTLGEQLGLTRLLKSLKPDLVHFLAPNTPLFYRGRRLVTIHDLTLLDYDTSRGSGVKRVLRGLKRLPFRIVFLNNAWSATGLVTGVQYVKDQMIRRFRVNPKRLTVISLGTNPLEAEPESIESFGAGKSFVLSVGNFFPYKNVDSSVSAMKLLASKRPALRLVLTGKPDYFRTKLEAWAKELGIEDRVIFTGFVTDGELVGLYRHASLYTYPSLSEGFGLQGLEAMAQGLPVLAAKASCLPEVYGDAAVYFDPKDPKDQAEKIDDLLNNKGLRERLVKSGQKRMKRFSWRKTAEGTLEVYRKIGGVQES